MWLERPAVQEPGRSRSRGAPRTKTRVAPGEAPRTLAPLLAPTLVPNADKRSESLSIAGNPDSGSNSGVLAVSDVPVNRKDSLATAVSESCESGREDLNLRPLGPEPSALAKLSYAPSFGYPSSLRWFVNVNKDSPPTSQVHAELQAAMPAGQTIPHWI